MFLYFVIFTVLGVFISANLIIGILVKHILSVGNLSDVFASANKSSKRRSMGSNDSSHDINHDTSVRTLPNREKKKKSPEEYEFWMKRMAFVFRIHQN